MYKTICLSVLFVLFSSKTFCQSVFEDYNHVIIPTKFDFQERENEYQLNSLLRKLFKDEGFNTFMDTEITPIEYSNNPCKGLYVEVEKIKNILQVNVALSLLDCRRKVVISSTGSSKEKEFRKGYQEAIRDAFLAVEKANFSLNPTRSSTAASIESKSLSKDERIEMRKETVRQQSEVFSLDEEELYFFPEDGAIHIYGPDAYNIIAKLKPISENMFIFNSDDVDGVLTRQSNKDFELEYREKDSKETKTKIYKFIKEADNF